jgi:hypothetical protein
MGRATALEFVAGSIAHATVGHQPQAASPEAAELLPTVDNHDVAEVNWESAWIDLGGEG